MMQSEDVVGVWIGLLVRYQALVLGSPLSIRVERVYARSKGRGGGTSEWYPDTV